MFQEEVSCPQVPWRRASYLHLRYNAQLDALYRLWKRGAVSASCVRGILQEMRPMPRAKCTALAAHGGETLCTLDFADGTYYSGWAHCSWRDLFCARTGRLYALCDALIGVRAAGAHKLTLSEYAALLMHYGQLSCADALALAGMLCDIGQEAELRRRVKGYCAEIVARRRDKRK